MPKYKPSILQADTAHCYLCGRSGQLECHHVFGKYQRKMSTEQGFTVMLCHACHNEPPNGVHFNQVINKFLKAQCERKYLETHTLDEWMSLVGRNFIETDNLTEA